jgi:hypothetical protein
VKVKNLKRRKKNRREKKNKKVIENKMGMELDRLYWEIFRKFIQQEIEEILINKKI